MIYSEIEILEPGKKNAQTCEIKTDMCEIFGKRHRDDHLKLQPVSMKRKRTVHRVSEVKMKALVELVRTDSV